MKPYKEDLLVIMHIMCREVFSISTVKVKTKLASQNKPTRFVCMVYVMKRDLLSRIILHKLIMNQYTVHMYTVHIYSLRPASCSGEEF